MDVSKAAAPLNLHHLCVCGQLPLAHIQIPYMPKCASAKYVMSHQREIVSAAITEV